MSNLSFCQHQNAPVDGVQCQNCFNHPQSIRLRAACLNRRMNCVALNIDGKPREVTQEQFDALMIQSTSPHGKATK